MRVEETSFRQIIAVFVFSFVLGYVLVNWYQHTAQLDGQLPLGVDFYPRWVGSRAFWQGESPYSEKVEQETQNYVFGEPSGSGIDTFGFYYPAHIAIVLAPFILLPAQEAAFLWIASTWAILSVFVFLVVKNVPGKASPWLLLLVALTIFFQRSALLILLNGQYVFFVLACWGLAYYLIKKEHDIPAGFLLALSTIKPSLSFLPLLIFLYWTFKTRRIKVILSFLITCGLFLFISLFQIGWWLPEFLTQLGKYDDFPRQWVPANILTPTGMIWLGGTAVLIYIGIREHLKKPDEFPWFLFWGSISLILLATPHTAEYDLPILLLPFILLAPCFLQTKTGILIWVTLFWLPWLTWLFCNLIGLTTSYWYSIYWFHYPQILVLALLAFFFITSRQKKEADLGDGSSLIDQRSLN